MGRKIYSAANRGPRVQIDCGSESRTKQSMGDECDINLIMAKYVKTGHLSHVNNHGASYDFASGVSYHEAITLVTEADQMFAELPAQTRGRFANDPAGFLDFVQDPANEAEMREMGLLAPETTEEAVEPVVPPLVADPPGSPEEAAEAV